MNTRQIKSPGQQSMQVAARLSGCHPLAPSIHGGADLDAHTTKVGSV